MLYTYMQTYTSNGNSTQLQKDEPCHSQQHEWTLEGITLSEIS